jgi:hypothetical protein
MPEIIPYEKTTTVQITSFSVENIKLELNKYAVFRVVLYGDNKMPVAIESVAIEGDDYKKWSSDDDFVLQYIATKLGFELVEK